MIAAAMVERFRGIRLLEVDGFGRVNLIIGKNNCGKTALMEALVIAGGADGAASTALSVQRLRRSGIALGDFERFWRPLFWNQDADEGFSIEVRGSQPVPFRVELRKSASPPVMLTESPADVTGASATWALDVRIADGSERTQRIVGSAAGLRILLPPPPLPRMEQGGSGRTATLERATSACSPSSSRPGVRRSSWRS